MSEETTVPAWNAKVATVIKYGGETRTLSGINRVSVTTTSKWTPTNSIYRFNTGYVFHNQQFRFEIYMLANSGDVPFLRQIADQKKIFSMEVKSAVGYTDPQFGLVTEIYHLCIIENEEVAFQVDVGPPVVRFTGRALRKEIRDRNGTKVYEVGSGTLTLGSNDDPFYWLNNEEV